MCGPAEATLQIVKLGGRAGLRGVNGDSMTTSWPAFDPGEAINQIVSAVVTLAAVVVGGSLAFRAGVRQLRRERQLDRRLRWYERSTRSIQDYITHIGVYLGLERDVRAGDASKEAMRYESLNSLTSQGRRLQDLLGYARLYAAPDEVVIASELFTKQLNVYMASWRLSMEPGASLSHIDELKGAITRFDEAREMFEQNIRRELDLAPIPKRRLLTGDQMAE